MAHYLYIEMNDYPTNRWFTKFFDNPDCRIIITEIKQNNNQQNQSQSNNNQIKEDTAKENNNSYIGVPNPNDFNYSFHKGKIEYSSMDACLSASERISLKDTVDIINSWCMDVVDGQGTVLGEYLYINCSSGNCNKYKD